MHDAFQPLVARVRPLGNTSRKYLRTIERDGDAFLSRLELSGVLSSIHLDRTSPAIGEDFQRIAAAARGPEETLSLLGTYYAVQFLHQNARTLEQLAYDLAERSARQQSYASFLERNEAQFSQLVSIYIEHVLRIVTPAGAGRFVILNVGTLGHQDDIDMAVLHDGCGSSVDVDRAVARLASQCQRYASPLDNYFAADVGAAGFCLSVDELHSALRAGGVGFVLVTELLRAEPVFGERQILERLRQEVTGEYYFRSGHDNARHELYLRGILGESRSLLLRPPPASHLNPKDDALRLIIGLAMAFKTIDGIVANATAPILREAMGRRPELREALSRLEQSLVFLETFWQTAQLLVALDEEVAIEGQAARENLESIATAMGYRERGSVQAVEHLLVHYHEAVENAHDAAAPLMKAVAQHLTRRSRFSRWARGKPPQDFATKLARILVTAARAFRSVRFYDDLIEAFAAPGGRTLDAFVASFGALSAEQRQELARLYAIWGCDAPYTLMTLLTLIAGRGESGRASAVVEELLDAFLTQLAESPEVEAQRAVSRVFRGFPALGNRFLFLLDEQRLARFDAALAVGIANPEVAAARDRYRALIAVQKRSSRYVKRVIARVTERHPATVNAISDDASLRTLALGQLAASERHDSPEAQKSLLGDFYDIEFLRIAMRTLRGAPIAFTRTTFNDLTTTYLERLFDLCYRQAEHTDRGWISGRDQFGIFLAGGNARGRPYDEDYDLLAVLDSDDRGMREFLERVVVLMNGQIARRGVIPQYRLGEWLKHYVATVDELEALFAGNDQRLFVDRCQLIGARMVVGSRRLAACLLERVVRPHIFEKADAYAREVVREIEERRQAQRTIPPTSLHLKEDRGGLREIDLALVAAKARFGVWETPTLDPFEELARRDPTRAGVYRRLAAINDFIVALRSAYRVAVSATATIEREYLAAPARMLGCEGRGDDSAADVLFVEVQESLAESASLVDRILRDVVVAR